MPKIILNKKKTWLNFQNGSEVNCLKKKVANNNVELSLYLLKRIIILLLIFISTNTVIGNLLHLTTLRETIIKFIVRLSLLFEVSSEEWTPWPLLILWLII